MAGLSPLGWSVVESNRPELLFALTRTLDSGLDATVRVRKPQGVWGPLVVVSGIEVGVGCRPLRELASLTCAYGLEVQSSRVFADGVLALDLYDEDDFEDNFDDEDDEFDEFEDEERRPEFEFRTHTPAEARTVAQQLVEVVTEHGSRIADRYADVNELIAALPGVRAAALLAATGRLEEAAAVLDGLSGRSGLAWPDDRRCVYQLRRWISSAGDHSLLPAKPPPPRWQSREKQSGEKRPSFSEAKRRARERSATRQAAYQAARERARGLDRDEQRAILEQELDAAGLAHSPIDLELSLEHLWDTKADQWMNVGKGAVRLGRFGIRAFRALRGNEQLEREFEERFDRMDQLEPPDPAFFETPTDGDHVSVELNEGIDATLEQIYELTWPKVMGVGTIQEAWLKPADHGRITVHVGEWELGTIAADAAEAFAQTMREAGFREELPKLPARIAQLGKPPRYMVEVARPAPW